MAATAHIQTANISPLEAYRRLAGDGPSFLLESAERGRLGRFSLVGSGSRVVGFDGAAAELAGGRPIVGYLGYDHVRHLEPIPLPAVGALPRDGAFVVAETLLRLDHLTGTAEVLAGNAREVAARLAARGPDRVSTPHPRSSRTRRFPSRRSYERMVRRAGRHIADGDVFQVVLSQRAERRTSASRVAIYRALRRINPSPYLFFLELGDLALIGSSPETLVKLEGRRASVNPIAGTTPRGPGDEERLLASEKDRAEHIMLVDLARNDLARACIPGTVRVERFLQPEAYSHVTHLVSEVAGELHPDVTPLDLLLRCFPAGTVTGAPKVRAMQLISELEGVRRGAYAGAVGYALPDGTLDTCIAIRMVVLEGGLARMQAGAGIVADSDPAAEHAECLAKLAALEAAVLEAER